MAAGYWDYDSTASTTTSDYISMTSTSAGTATSNEFYDCSSSYRPRVRRILVETPKSWSEVILAAYIKMVNKETNTGWKVDMVINGDIKIVDPDVELRTMEQFRLILLKYANDKDAERIKAFFAEHGV